MEVVHRDHLVRVDEPARERGADEAGAARDQHALARQRHAGMVDGGPRGDGVTSRVGGDVDRARMRVALVLGCALALLAPVALGAPATTLTITYYDDSDRRGERVRWTLRCGPVGGDHPRRVATCRELGRLGWRAFRPVPPEMACTEIYGGPQLAIVSGRVGGRRVWARLTRVDGCQIARWDRVPSLLPRRRRPLTTPHPGRAA